MFQRWLLFIGFRVLLRQGQVSMGKLHRLSWQAQYRVSLLNLFKDLYLNYL